VPKCRVLGLLICFLADIVVVLLVFTARPHLGSRGSWTNSSLRPSKSSMHHACWAFRLFVDTRPFVLLDPYFVELCCLLLTLSLFDFTSIFILFFVHSAEVARVKCTRGSGLLCSRPRTVLDKPLFMFCIGTMSGSTPHHGRPCLWHVPSLRYDEVGLNIERRTEEGYCHLISDGDRIIGYEEWPGARQGQTAVDAS
jgi:hypothetical protein